MARLKRMVLPGYPHHIVQRGHNRQPCFHGADDCALYLGLLKEYSNEHCCAVHAYVLMTNHVHLLVTPEDAGGISAMLRIVNQRFVQSVNRRRERCGSSWQGRFRSSVVQSDAYLITCQRYIEMNPVRARMVGSAGDYRWSSFHANATGMPDLLVTPHATYIALHQDERRRRLRYAELFAKDLPEAEIDRIRLAARGGRPLGDEAFVAALARRLGPGVVIRKRGPQPRVAEPAPRLF